jgi:hypothetical protein
MPSYWSGVFLCGRCGKSLAKGRPRANARGPLQASEYQRSWVVATDVISVPPVSQLPH